MTKLLSLDVARNGYTLKGWLVGGESFDIVPPIRPYFSTTTTLPNVNPEQIILLSDLHSQPLQSITPCNVWKQECRTVYDLKRARTCYVTKARAKLLKD